MFLGFWTNNLFMPGMFWCFQTICIFFFIYMICLLVFPSFNSIVDAFLRPYGELENFCLNTLFVLIGA